MKNPRVFRPQLHRYGLVTTVTVLILLSFLAPMRSSAQILYNTTVDLTSSIPVSNGLFYREAFTFGNGTQTLFSLASGQTLSGTVTFANNQALTLSAPLLLTGNEYDFTLNFVAPGAGDTYATTSIQLLGVNGQLFSPNPYPGSVGSDGGNTTNIFAFDTIMGGPAISFTGFSYTINMSNNLGGQDFNTGYFAINAPSGISVGSVPEPNPARLILLGLLITYFVIRYRRFIRGKKGRTSFLAAEKKQGDLIFRRARDN